MKIDIRIAALAVFLVTIASLATNWVYFEHVYKVAPPDEARDLQVTNLVLMLGLTAVAAIAATIIGRTISRPLSRITKLAATFPNITDASKLPVYRKDEIGLLARSLSRIVTESNKQEWLRTGQLKIAEAARGALGTEETARNVLKALCKHLNAPLGAFYKASDDGTLSLIAGFTVNGQSKALQEVEPGNSILAVALEDGLIQIDNDIPEDYFRVHSGLGATKPRHRLIAPLRIEQSPIGVIELASLEPFTDQHKLLLELVTEAVGLAVVAAQARDGIERMLFHERTQSEELRSTNEQLEKQAAEMEQQAAEMERQQDELKQQATEMEAQNRQLEEQKTQIEEQARNIEHQLLEIKRASKYKSEFLANMSHELRTPLNSLLILAKSFESNEDGNLTDEQVEEAAMIYNGGVELLTLINDVLDFSKIEAGQINISRDHTPVATMAKKLIKQFTPVAKENEVVLESDINQDVPETIYTDAQRLEQILKNLMSNAVKFSRGGKVKLAVSSDESQVLFLVIDTGIGISPKKQEEIFEAFRQADGSIDRQYGGTGLGLSISRQLADLLGGEISVDSEEGKGSTFTLSLPLAAADEDERAQGDRSADAMVTFQTQTLRKIVKAGLAKNTEENTLLIVEDDNKFAATIKKLASKAGYTPLIANTGKDALMMVHAQMPVAVILDLALPDMNGLKVLDQIKGDLKTRHIPVHIVSAFDEQDNVPLRKGAMGYLTKPVTPTQIDAMFARVANINQSGVKNVLIIEDDHLTQTAIEKLLRNKDAEITVAGDGKAALKKLAQQNFDCIILDLQLPDINGLEWLRSVKDTHYPHVPPVIVYTAKELSKAETQQLEEYTDSIIIKGVHSDERLVDDVTLFLHSLGESLTDSQRKIVTAKTNASEPLRGKKVLLVDDDMRNVFAISKMLKKQEMEVVVADNGEMALEQLDSENDVSAVVMDIMMPLMDGYEATKMIRTHPIYKNVPIIALTARAAADEREKCLNAGATDYLAKPVDIDVLLTLLRVLLFEQKMGVA